MADQLGTFPIKGSSHRPLPGALPALHVNGKEHYEINVMLRRRPDGPPLMKPEEIGAQPPRLRQHLDREEFERLYGADPADVEAVRKFAAEHQLDVVQTSLARRKVTLAGTAAQFSRALSTNLFHFVHAGGSYRGHHGPLYVPAELGSIVTSIVGLDERPIAVPMARPHPALWSPYQVANAQLAAAAAVNRHLRSQMERLAVKYRLAIGKDTRESAPIGLHPFQSPARGNTPVPYLAQVAMPVAPGRPARSSSETSQLAADYRSDLRKVLDRSASIALETTLDALGIKTPPQVAAIYDFPKGTDGSGQCIGIIELGGGYRRTDLENYFRFIGTPMPDISDVLVGGGINLPGVVEPYDGEVCLDIEVIGGAAPGAKLVCYFAPLTAKGFIEAVHTAIHDRENKPSVISASWNLSEGFWLQVPMFVSAFEEVLSEAAVLGVTICCPAGDYGSYSEFLDGRLWVDYPASSPHVLGCGGTTLHSTGDQVVSEVVWNTLASFGQATGGGISRMFALPAWQQSADIPQWANTGGTPGRGVPDVAANADPSTGYLIQVDGKTTVICGTSSGAPLWAALIARINQSLGLKVGYLNPFLYQSVNHIAALRDILVVGNGVYDAREGWDPCTGWGSPNGSKLRDALGA